MASLQLSTMEAATEIAREIELFGNAVTAVYTTSNQGSSIDSNTQLPTNLYEDPVPLAGILSAETTESNEAMRRALTNELAGKLAISVWEIVKHTEHDHCGNPEIKFLKHVRNGVAHNNEFSFKSREHYNNHSPAEWNENEITFDMEEIPVLTTFERSSYFVKEADIIEGYLEGGDIKELCQDILTIVS